MSFGIYFFKYFFEYCIKFEENYFYIKSNKKHIEKYSVSIYFYQILDTLQINTYLISHDVKRKEIYSERKYQRRPQYLSKWFRRFYIFEIRNTKNNHCLELLTQRCHHKQQTIFYKTNVKLLNMSYRCDGKISFFFFEDKDAEIRTFAFETAKFWSLSTLKRFIQTSKHCKEFLDIFLAQSGLV